MYLYSAYITRIKITRWAGLKIKGPKAIGVESALLVQGLTAKAPFVVTVLSTFYTTTILPRIVGDPLTALWP